MSDKPQKPMEEIIAADGRYPREAFGLLHEGLNRAVRDVHGRERGAEPGESDQRHVTGRQLCESLRDLALERWGMLAQTVLAKWNVRGTIDFGNMVYLLIEHGFMRKTDEDSIEDFRDIYDFEQAFEGTDSFELKE